MRRLSRLAAIPVLIGVLSIAGSASALPIIDLLLGGKPGVDATAATSVTTSTARLNGSVHPNGRGTDYFFEYGPTIAYGARTNEGSVGGGGSWKTITANLVGLQPSTTYHFRLVADNSRGTSRTADMTFTTAALPPPDPGEEPDPDPDPDPGTDPGTGNDTKPGDTRGLVGGEGGKAPDEPKLGASVVVAPGQGDLRVRRPGRSSFEPLAFGSELPVGTEVDASRGSIALTSALPSGGTQSGRFGGGRFVIRQGRRGYIDLYLRGRACVRTHRAHGVATVASAARRPKSRRRLWGRDQGGRFRTHGKNSHATVRGTRWVVTDSCAGTLTRVTQGAVTVRDTVRHRRVLLEAGERYLARPRG